MTYVVASSDNLYILTVDETNVNNLFEDNFLKCVTRITRTP